MKLVDIFEDDWAGIPWRTVTGDKPKEKDTPPTRLPNGDYVFYHGTSLANAEKIIDEKQIKKDGLGYCGVATTPAGASIYGIMKDKTSHVVLKVVISEKWFKDHPNVFTRETGGSGKDQFLIRTSVVPLVAGKIIRHNGESIGEAVEKLNPTKMGQAQVLAALRNAGWEINTTELSNVKFIKKYRGNDGIQYFQYEAKFDNWPDETPRQLDLYRLHDKPEALKGFDKTIRPREQGVEDVYVYWNRQREQWLADVGDG